MTPRLRALVALVALVLSPRAAAQAGDWTNWRGPHQNGTSSETGLPDTVEVGGEGHLWSYPIAGRGTPAISRGRVFCVGYEGEGPDLQEVVLCLDEETGERIWEHRFHDFLSDVTYDRYSIGAPSVDPRTGLVYVHTTPGLLSCFTAEGELLWQHSLMEELGRMTFPNGRNGSPLVAGDRVIVHHIFSSWGPLAPARDRFYAFDKLTGEALWVSTPGGSPKDNSFSHPVLATRDGRLLLYAGTGCGHVVCVDVGTGDPVWRYQLSQGGINSAVLVDGDTLYAIHARENLDSSVIGRMLSIDLGQTPDAPPAGGPAVLDASVERWRNELLAFTSSPVLVGDRIYETIATGDLCCVNAETGEVLWKEKLAPDQIHASPVHADGKLYVPMTNGSFHIVRPTDEGPEILDSEELEGSCLGAPAIANGRVYVHTTGQLYCFGSGAAASSRGTITEDPVEPGAPARLQVVPADVVLHPGQALPFHARVLDRRGRRVADAEPVEWDTGRLGVTLDSEGFLRVADDAAPATGMLKAAAMGLAGAARIRIVPNPPYRHDFEDVELGPHPDEEGVLFAPAPSHWIGAGKKWEVRELDGGKVLAKTLDVTLFQRTLSFFGHPGMSGYTMQVDVRSDGNRRSMSTAGVIHQRYMVLLKGNHQEIEVSSNMERIKEVVPFQWKVGEWYTLKTRVDVAEDGSGVVRAKAWKRGEAEPDGWLIEVPHADAHRSGSPGLFGFSPQSRFRVYVDNLSVTPNE